MVVKMKAMRQKKLVVVLMMALLLNAPATASAGWHWPIRPGDHVFDLKRFTDSVKETAEMVKTVTNTLAELRNQLKMLAAAGDLEGMWYALEQAKDLPWGRQAKAYDDVYREARDQDELYVPYIPILDESRELDNELVEVSAQQTVSNQTGRMQAQQSLTAEETEGVLGEKQKRNVRQALDGLSTIDRAELLGSQLQQAVGEQEMMATSRRIEQEKAKDGVFYGYDPYHPSDFDRAHRAGNTQNFGFLKYGAYRTED